MKAGDSVVFTGSSYRVARIYKYHVLFQDKTLKIKEVKKDCCNKYLIFEEIEGAYNEKLFSSAQSAPTPP